MFYTVSWQKFAPLLSKAPLKKKNKKKQKKKQKNKQTKKNTKRLFEIC